MSLAPTAPAAAPAAIAPPTAADLRHLIDTLAKPPFSKPKLSVVALHDDLPHPDFVALLNQVMAHIDASPGGPPSPHAIDIRNELPEATGQRMADFLVVSLGFPAERQLVAQKIVTGDDRAFLLTLLHFLLSDVPKSQQAAYRARYCREVELPLELSGDDQLQDLIRQLKERQAEFLAMLAQAGAMHEVTQTTADLKRDVAQMEEEKQLVLGKIQRMQRRVTDIPNAHQWLAAARSLRTEQDREHQLADRQRDLKIQCTAADDRLASMQKRVAEMRELERADPATILDKMQKDVQTSTFIAKDQLPKELASVKQAVSLLQKITSEPPWPAAELVKLEHEVDSLADQVKELTEKRVQNHSTQDKLSLFRQQASVIANKKSATANKVRESMLALDTIKAQHTQLLAAIQANPATANMPRGDDFKAYVADLRTKSSAFKTKRATLAALSAELALAQRTREILAQRKQVADRQLQALEQRHGVSGLRATRTTLEQVSERKGGVDAAKAEVVEDLAGLVQSLIKAVADKKAVLAPKIAELKTLRATLGEVEGQHSEQKRSYDAVVLSLETEIQQLQVDIRNMRSSVQQDTSRWHLVTHELGVVDVQMDTVLQEMKAYIGGGGAGVGDGSDESLLRAKGGFKTWRDMYQRKVLEAEAAARQVKEQLRQVTERHEANLVQVQLFTQVRGALQARIAANRKLMERAERRGGQRADEIVSVNEQRLVIS